MIVGVFSDSGKDTPLFEVGRNSGLSVSATSTGLTVIFLLLSSSTACISSHLFVVVPVEPIVAVTVLVEDGVELLETVVNVVLVPVASAGVVAVDDTTVVLAPVDAAGVVVEEETVIGSVHALISKTTPFGDFPSVVLRMVISTRDTRLSDGI